MWDGGKEISVSSGYWRLSTNSTTIVSCPNSEAWLVGYYEDTRFPVECADGYEGYIWSSWISNSSVNYERVEAFACSKCPDAVLNGLKVSGLFLLFIIFLIGLITINIK